ncbi:MAG: glycosyltransferase [Bacteroidia bacterium]|nr:glycosyltransferase [Bacteroidia bacterium]
MPENILIYYPSAKRSNVLETLALEFSARGHHIFFLTHAEKDELHEALEKQGINVFSFYVPKTTSVLFYLKHFFFLISFCRRHKISAVQSHLQTANIVSVLAQFFIRAKVVNYRHHLIENNRTSRIFDKIINRLAKKIVVPSSVILEKMTNEEQVPAKKIKLVPYVYDFSKYSSSPERVAEIKQMHPAKLRILLCGRFVPLKRNDLAIRAVAALIEKGQQVCLMALDSGPGLEECKQLVRELNIENQVYFIGYTSKVLDYIAACDVLVHPSFTEASNNTVKEAALFSKKVIVCEGVGDFSDFIINGKNGYLVSRENPLPELIKALEEIYEGRGDMNMGDELKKTVMQKFQKSTETIDKHLDLLVR